MKFASKLIHGRQVHLCHAHYLYSKSVSLKIDTLAIVSINLPEPSVLKHLPNSYQLIGSCNHFKLSSMDGLIHSYI